jgi:ribonucleoside-diphosphate reductase alpha chain
MQAWKSGLKGVTIYRDGSRSGVLITNNKVKTDKFGYTDAIKRPVELEADYHYVKSNGNSYAVIVGLMNNKPYEIFAFDNPIVDKTIKGIITKEGKGVYSFKNGISSHSISNIQLSSFTEERVLTRWTSQLLRHGVNPKYIADQVDKSEVIVTSFAKAISRVLKRYVLDEYITNELCPSCNEPSLIREEGCKKCKSCGHSVC